MSEPIGSLVAVQGISPGVGRSSIAANLAFDLAATGSRVCLVDLDHNRPSLHRYFAIQSQQAAVLAAMRFVQQQRMDANAFEQFSNRLVAGRISVDFLSGYGLNLNPDAIEVGPLNQLVGYLRERFEYVVVDCPTESSPSLSTVVGAADHSVLVAGADPIGIGRLLDLKHNIQLAETSTLVVNRVRSSVLGARPEWQIQQVLRDRTNFANAIFVPEDSALDLAMQRSLPLGQVAKKSKAAQALAALAGRVGSKPQA